MEWESETMDVLCLGLGSPSESRSARLQLSLVLELLAELGIVCSYSFVDKVVLILSSRMRELRFMTRYSPRRTLMV